MHAAAPALASATRCRKCAAAWGGSRRPASTRLHHSRHCGGEQSSTAAMPTYHANSTPHPPTDAAAAPTAAADSVPARRQHSCGHPAQQAHPLACPGPVPLGRWRLWRPRGAPHTGPTSGPCSPARLQQVISGLPPAAQSGLELHPAHAAGSGAATCGAAALPPPSARPFPAPHLWPPGHPPMW